MKGRTSCRPAGSAVPKWTEETTVCFLHGLGSSASAFRESWRRWGKGPRRWFLDGPEADCFTSERRWFPFTNRPDALARGVVKAADFVEKELALRDLPPSLVLAGHSQGAMVCLELVRRRRLPISAAWCYSSFLPAPLRVPILGATRTTVLHLLSSEADRFIEPCQVDHTAQFFRSQAGIEVHRHISSRLPHRFSQEWLDATNFRVGCNDLASGCSYGGNSRPSSNQRGGLMQSDQNPFSKQSKAYAQARPHYPADLYEWVASECASTNSAWDCATGNGQAAVGLAPFFDQVQATDISGAQITHALERPNIVYSVRSAEASGFAASSFDLIVVAQALHWFEFIRFWPEVSRVARPCALFCAWGYSWLSSTPAVDAALVMPFRKALEPFWAPNNRILWEGYRSEDIAFPYARMSTPHFEIQARWTLEQLIEYMCTWSAYKHSRSDAAAVEAVDSAVARVRGIVASDEPLPIRIPLKLVAGRITALSGGGSAS